MALPPSIPTSFVPHAASQGRPARGNWSGVFALIGYGLLGLMVVIALGVFAYGRILAVNQASADAALAKAEANIDAPTVESFVQLHDRLTSAKTLLANHIALSNFFSVLSTILPQTVQFTSLQVSVDSTGAIKMNGSGVAANFNALAAASQAFGKDGRIKDVIFSKMSIKKNNSVSFYITGTIDPSLVAYTPSAASQNTAPATPSVASTTTATTTASSTAL